MPSFMHSYLTVVVWTGIVSFAMGMMLAVAMVFLRISQRLSSDSERTFLATWRRLLLSSLDSSVPAALPVLEAGYRLYFLKLWNALMRTATPQAAANLSGLAYAVGADHFSRRFVRTGNRVECLLGALTLGKLRDQASWDALVMRTLAPDHATSINAFHALVQIDAEAAAQQLTPLLLARNDWPVAQAAAIVQTAQSAFMFPLIEATADARATHLIRTLRLIESLKLALPQTTIRRLLENVPGTEALIAILRIANDVSVLTHVRPYLEHEDWRVRVQAAKLLGRIGEHADANRLIPLLADVEWWVRYRAAQALTAMPFFSRAELELLRDHLSDRFARDMLGQVLAERNPS